MKIETLLTAERDAVAARVLVSPGARVDAKDLLVEFRPSLPFYGKVPGSTKELLPS